jgi:hypothetical protein
MKHAKLIQPGKIESHQVEKQDLRIGEMLIQKLLIGV